MRKIHALALIGSLVMLSSCEKPVISDGSFIDEDGTGGEVVDAPTKKFTFTVKGDFSSPNFMRAGGYLSADGQDMTDLWVFDYVDGECVQSVHQQPSTAGDEWGKPVLRLRHGTHHVYFVASRGESPMVDDAAHTVTWGTPRDTFWKDYEVEVTGTSNGNRAVTLDRVATKLRVCVLDEIPDGCASVAITPDKWYYGLDYVTGDAVGQRRTDRVITVPSSYIGTEGSLALSIFGLSGAQEWQTDVTVQARNASGGDLGTAVIHDAPFIRNRSTEYSGCLFSTGVTADLTLSTAWSDPHVGEF
jgi:hypothetical protein